MLPIDHPWPSWRSIKTILCVMLLTFSFKFCKSEVTAQHHQQNNSQNLDICKLSDIGTEYFGTRSTTVSGEICQYWDIILQSKDLATNITNAAFPDSSVKLARNYCRNPTKDPDGPWCYSAVSKEKQSCGIPFCDYKVCRHSGPGQEYQGNLQKSASTLNCLPWNNSVIPENFVQLENLYCSNPMNDIAGPSCNVFTENGEENQLCDIPICDFPVYGRLSILPEYSIFTELNKSTQNMTIAVRLWNPEIDVKMDKGPSILFSTMSSKLATTGIELEIVPAHRGGGIVLRKWPIPTEVFEYIDVVSWKPERAPFIVAASGLTWTYFWVSWGKNNISAGQVGLESIDRVFLEIDKDNYIKYYSLAGPRTIWEMKIEEPCETHITSSPSFSQLWPLPKSETGFTLKLMVQAYHSALLRLYHGPDPSRAVMQVSLQQNKTNTIHLLKHGTTESILSENFEPKIFSDPWQWSEFSIIIFGDKLQVLWKINDTASESLLETVHSKVKGIRWFGIASNGTLTQWALQCKYLPATLNDTITTENVPPECAANARETGYAGHQRCTKTGRPCLPWTVDAKHNNDSLYPYSSVIAASNFCRNPNNSVSGTWCNVFVSETNDTIIMEQEVCSIRKCKFRYCRMAGTGNDYMGTQNVTISGRTCQNWLDNYPHIIPNRALNETRFPELSIKEAKNYCRNPDRNLTGSWCYTTDPLVPFDMCYIRNCEKADECTIITVKSIVNSSIYILPKWREEGLKFWLKEWDPDMPDGIEFMLKPLGGKDYYSLQIGARNNEAIELYHINKHNNKYLEKEKGIPHIIPMGKWKGFWLKTDKGQVKLGFEGDHKAIFDWKHRSTYDITPMMFNIGSIKQNLIGIHFPCDDCLTHHFEGKNVYDDPKILENIYPIHLGRPNGWNEVSKDPYKQVTLDFYARGKGHLLVKFLQFPKHQYFADVMLGHFFMLNFKDNTRGYNKMPYSEMIKNTSNMLGHEFRKFTFKFNETDFHVSYPHPDTGEIVDWSYTHEDGEFRNLFYYFVVRVNGAVDWSANCPPIDTYGEPRDGGWSEWSPWNCTVHCGGGTGFRTRNCNNPEPNVFGKYCSGKNILYGPCNQFPCGRVSLATHRATKLYLNSQFNFYKVKEGENVNYNCEPPTLQRVVGELEGAVLMWTKNGLELNNTIFFNTTALVLTNLTRNDSGIYTLVAQGNSSSSTLCLTTVAVLTYITLRSEESLELPTNALSLETVYSDLKLNWILNNTVWKREGNTPMTQLEILKIKEVNYSHAGDWTCVVIQIVHGFAWTTAWYNVEVLSPKSISMKLMEDPVVGTVFNTVGKTFGENFVVPLAITLIVLLIILMWMLASFFISWRRMLL